MLPLCSLPEDLLMARDMTGLGIVGVFEPITESSRSLSLFVIDKHLVCSTDLTTSDINLLNCRVYNNPSMQETFLFVNYTV